jgi:membrane-associated phospholipid phosphatase
MTMLTHSRGPFERAPYSAGSGDADRAGAAATYLATIRRLLMRILLLLAAVGALAAIMALKIAIYLPALFHH